MSTDDNALLTRIAATVDSFMHGRGYPNLVGEQAPRITLTSKECRTHGILYSCSKCGWNHCMVCMSSIVMNSTRGVSGWMGRCSGCAEPQASVAVGLSTGRVDVGSEEYNYVLRIIDTSVIASSAFYNLAPFSTHGIPAIINHGFRVHEIMRHTSEYAVRRFAKSVAEANELRAMRTWDHGLPPTEEYPIFIGCCRDEADRIGLRGFCPYYTETNDGPEGVIFGSKFFPYAMGQADRGAASLRLINPDITPPRRYVCIARALTGRLEELPKTARSIRPSADTGGDLEGWVRAYFDASQLKLEYIVTYSLVPLGEPAELDMVWGC